MLMTPPKIGEFKIEKTHDGAIRLSIGAASCVLPPDQAIRAATAILTGCGISVALSNATNAFIHRHEQ